MTAPAPPAPAPAPRQRVEATTPTPARYGLLSAATVLDGGDLREMHGVEYQAVCGGGVTTYPAPCPPVDPGLSTTKVPQATTAWVAADPMSLYAAEDCPPVGRDQATARAQLRQRFLAAEPTALEQAVWTGDAGNAPSLVASAGVLNGGVALDVATALALVETWLAANVGQGIVHAPRYLAGQVDPRDRRPSGQNLVTGLGNTWALGAGYPGTGPEGQTADTDTWIYATAPVTVRRGALIEPAEWNTGGFNTSNNSTFLLTERLYVTDWACPAVAVRTNQPRLDLTVTEPTGATV